MTFADKPFILGLIDVIDFRQECRIEIKLLAVSSENKGRAKSYEGIAGCLIAFVARMSLLKYGALACVSLKPKTELRKHYMAQYGMKQAGEQLYLDSFELMDVINKYNL